MKRSARENFIIVRRLRLTIALKCESEKSNPLARGRFRKQHALVGTRIRGSAARLRRRAAVLCANEQLVEL